MPYRTDLAVEALEHSAKSKITHDAQQTETEKHGFTIISTDITNPADAKILGKPQGRYRTLDLHDLMHHHTDAFPNACAVLVELLRELLPVHAQRLLVVGLGNRDITPDAIGPQAISHILATRHLIGTVPEHFADWKAVSALAVGVLGQTGIETTEMLQGLQKTLQPDAILAIDALACSRLSRLLHTIQLTDTGIVPGSGVENARMALNAQTCGVPVIAIGVPTVVDGATLAHEIFSQVGQSTCEALVDLATPTIVTTRDIDAQVQQVSRVIGYAINLAIHTHLSLEDLELLLR